MSTPGKQFLDLFDLLRFNPLKHRVYVNYVVSHHTIVHMFLSKSSKCHHVIIFITKDHNTWYNDTAFFAKKINQSWYTFFIFILFTWHNLWPKVLLLISNIRHTSEGLNKLLLNIHYILIILVQSTTWLVIVNRQMIFLTLSG